MKYTHRNHYECPECGNTWDDSWDCEVLDDCARCGTKHIHPTESELIED